MPLQLVSAPAIEPITLSEAKTHLRVDGATDDTLVNSLIVTSRLHIEAALSIALITQNWRLVLDCWPVGDTLNVPLRPLSAVTEVRVIDGQGVPKIIDAISYSVDLVSNVPRIISRSGYWPMPGVRTSGIEIDVAAGYGDTTVDVPQPIRQALLLLIAHWYENREPAAIATPAARIPDTVGSLLEPYRVRCL